jgi:hypothetical protein
LEAHIVRYLLDAVFCVIYGRVLKLRILEGRKEGRQGGKKEGRKEARKKRRRKRRKEGRKEEGRKRKGHYVLGTGSGFGHFSKDVTAEDEAVIALSVLISSNKNFHNQPACIIGCLFTN